MSVQSLTSGVMTGATGQNIIAITKTRDGLPLLLDRLITLIAEARSGSKRDSNAFSNLRATCHLFATVAMGWNAKADVLGLWQHSTGVKRCDQPLW